MKVDRNTGEIIEATKQIVKVRFFTGRKPPDDLSPGMYTYFSVEPLALGDIIMTPVRDTVARAQVCAIDDSGTSIPRYWEQVKTIPAGSKVEQNSTKIETNTIDDDTEEAEEQAEQSNPTSEIQPGTALIRIDPGRDVSIQHFANECLKVQRCAEIMIVRDLDSERQATDDLAIIKKLQKEIEAKQKDWLSPIKEHEKNIKHGFSLLLDPLSAADKTLRDKTLAYRQEVERIRAEQEIAAELQRMANEARLNLAKQSGEDIVEIEPVPVVTAPEPHKTLRTDFGSTSITKTWKWRYKAGLSKKQILEALPTEYHTVNETLIGQLVRAKNKSPISEADFGSVIEIYEESGLRVTER